MAIEIRGQKYSLCSICEKHKKMSFTYIPPMSCGNVEKIKFSTLYKNSKQISEFNDKNCLIFKFICEECNNLMDKKYNASLGDFRKAFLEMVEKGSSTLNYDLTKTVKSIIGHFLASQPRGNSILQKYMREFFYNIDRGKMLKNNYSLYCFYYPYKEDMFIQNEYYIYSVEGDKTFEGNYSSFYFFPFAFIITEKNQLGENYDLLQAIKSKKPFVVSPNSWYQNGKLKSAVWPLEFTDGNTNFLFDSTKYSIIIK